MVGRAPPANPRRSVLLLRVRSVARQFNEKAVQASITGQLRMKGEGKMAALPDDNRRSLETRKNLNLWSAPDVPRSANKHARKRLFS